MCFSISIASLASHRHLSLSMISHYLPAMNLCRLDCTYHIPRLSRISRTIQQYQSGFSRSRCCLLSCSLAHLSLSLSCSLALCACTMALPRHQSGALSSASSTSAPPAPPSLPRPHQHIVRQWRQGSAPSNVAHMSFLTQTYASHPNQRSILSVRYVAPFMQIHPSIHQSINQSINQCSTRRTNERATRLLIDDIMISNSRACRYLLRLLGP